MSQNLHPYVTAELAILWLPDESPPQATAILTTGNRVAYRLTPAVYAKLHENVCQLETKWYGSADGLTEPRRAALVQAANTLRDLWEWMATRAPGGAAATEPARLPDVRQLVREVKLIEAAPPLDEFNPTLPVPEGILEAPKATAAGEVVPSITVVKKRKPTRKRHNGDAIATGTQSAGMFEGL